MSNNDRYSAKYALDDLFKQGLPGYELRVKFDNHTPITFKGVRTLIDNMEGYRVFHRVLAAHEKPILQQFLSGHGFTIFPESSDETSTVIIPTSKY